MVVCLVCWLSLYTRYAMIVGDKLYHEKTAFETEGYTTAIVT